MGLFKSYVRHRGCNRKSVVKILLNKSSLLILPPRGSAVGDGRGGIRKKHKLSGNIPSPPLRAPPPVEENYTACVTQPLRLGKYCKINQVKKLRFANQQTLNFLFCNKSTIFLFYCDRPTSLNFNVFLITSFTIFIITNIDSFSIVFSYNRVTS